MLHTLEFTGPFAYLKPWTAVRDGQTNSLQFLTPSTVEGIRQKLGVAAIPRYRLRWGGLDWQQELTHARGWVPDSRKRRSSRPRAILRRGVLLSPVLTLAFTSPEDAARALRQHICLSRNEDVLLPGGPVVTLTEAEFEALPGFELRAAAAEEPGAFQVGHHRYAGNVPMYGVLLVGRPAPSIHALSPD